MKFYILNVAIKHFGITKIQVIYENKELIKISGKNHDTYILKFSLTGVGELFYQAYFWYSVSTPRILIKQDMKRGEIITLKEE